MKKLLKTLILAASLLALISCASTVASKNEVKGTEEKEKSNRPFGIEEDVYKEFMDKAVISVGNNYRLKKVIEKLRAGEDVYIAALGGSVTEGAGPQNFRDGYAYQFCRKLNAAYTSNNGQNVHVAYAGLSGTPSSLGLTRYESDVVGKLGHLPDLLIIEFAVNDDGSDEQARAFEALVRNALLANDETAVIALYSAATYGNQANNRKSIAEYYRIPQIDVLPIVKDGIARGQFSQKDYYTDMVHPTKLGHEFQADCLMALVDKTDAQNLIEAAIIPEDWFKSKALTNFTRILGDDENVKIKAGSFDGTDLTTQSIKETGKGNFPQNWYHKSGSSGDSFVMEITCKALIFTYKEQGSWLNVKFGKADVYVDGKLKATFDGGKAGGWCNCVPKFIIDENELATHTVEVRMAEGCEKEGFTIVAMGYSK
ncbi:MAG: SGNH/GDSL hydrolase family protein [Treponema sp.]|nr:SGNH/GDSL hydrolase family protein [Treponema sp.]